MHTETTIANKPCKYGHTRGRGAENRCLECDRLRKRGTDGEAKRKAHYEANKKRIIAKSSQHRRENAEKSMLWSARERARRGAYPCTITAADIVIPEFCPVLGIKIEPALNKPGPASPSLDKIIPKLGYVPGNVWVISQRANQLKNNATLSELRLLVNKLSEIIGSFPWEVL